MNIPAKVRNGIFAILLSSCIVSSMVHTVLNTALFPIMEEFDISAARAQWLITAFSLVMGVMVLATASLIRRFPNRPLYLTFMGLFCLGLLLSAAAPSFSVLLIGRILQALGCGMLLSLTQVVVLSAYPSEAQGRVMGIYGLAVSAAPVLAPTLSGIVIDLFGWHMVFWCALILSGIVWCAGLAFMKNITPTEAFTFDGLSLALGACGFTGVVLGLGNAGSYGLFTISVLLPLMAGAVLLYIFTHRQFRLKTPFLNLSLFGAKKFRLSVIASMLLYASMMAATTLLPLYIQTFRGLGATASGLVTVPGSLVTAIFSLVAGRMYDKVGIRRLYLIGTCALLAGHSALVFLTAETSLWLVAFVFAVRSIGIGMLMMTTVNWGMSAVAAHYTSDGTALISSLRTVGGAMGTAVFVAVMSAAGGPQGEALLHGLQAAFAGVSMLSALLVILAIVCVGKEERPKNFDCNKEKHHAG